MAYNTSNIINTSYFERITEEPQWAFTIDEQDFIQTLQECLRQEEYNSFNNIKDN